MNRIILRVHLPSLRPQVLEKNLFAITQRTFGHIKSNLVNIHLV